MNEELKVIISAETKKFKKGVEDAKRQTNTFKQQLKKAAENVEDNFKNIGSSISNGFKTAAATVAGVATALVALGGSTQEYRNEQAKLVTAFEAAGSSAETAKGTYNDLYRVLGDGGQATEAASHLAKLTTQQDALAEWTNICKGVYATFGDSLPIEGLTEAANETARTGALTGGLADALNWAGVSEDAFQEKLDKCNTVAEREMLIRDTLNNLYLDAAAKYEENNAQVLAQNEAQAKLQETLAVLGEAVAPVITAFTSFANDALAVIVPYIQQLSEQYIPLLQSVLQTVSDTLGTVMGYLVDNWEIVLGVAGVIGGIATAIGLYNTVAAIKAAMDAAQVTTLWGLVAAYAAQAAAMIAAILPYVLIVAAIAAVVAAIIYCVKHWDEIKAKVKEVWENMSAKIAETAEKIKNKISELITKAKEKFEEMKTAISEKLTAAKNKAIEIFNSIKSGISEKINSIKSNVTNIFTNIVSTMKNKITSAKESVLNIFNSIKTGISNRITAAKDKVSSVIDAIKGFFDFEFKLPNIPKPHFGISPQGWSVGDLLHGSIPKLSISWYAKGGVFETPTLFAYGNGMLGGLGENGAEAVVPLEKNTEWLDKIAEKLAAKQGNIPIVLQVDGKTFAQISVDSINQLTKQTGNLPLRLV